MQWKCKFLDCTCGAGNVNFVTELETLKLKLIRLFQRKADIHNWLTIQSRIVSRLPSRSLFPSRRWIGNETRRSKRDYVSSSQSVLISFSCRCPSLDYCVFGGGNVNESFPIRLRFGFIVCFRGLSYLEHLIIPCDFPIPKNVLHSIRSIVSKDKKRPDVHWAQARKESYSEYFKWSSLFMSASTASPNDASHVK